MSYEQKLSNIEIEIYDVVKKRIAKLKGEDCLNFLSEKGTYSVTNNLETVKSIVNRMEENGLVDVYNDLPYGYFTDRHEYTSEFKIVGARKNNIEDSIGDFILYDSMTDDFKVIPKAYVDVSVVNMAMIADHF